MFVTLRGEPHLLWRPFDEHGIELDILVQKGRDKAVAIRFFERVPRSSPVPRKIVTDQLRSYPAAIIQPLTIGETKKPPVRGKNANPASSGV